MKKRTAVLASILVLLLLVVVFCGFRLNQSESRNDAVGLFSWTMEAMTEQQTDSLKGCIGAAGITEIYQEFTAESLRDGTAAAFVKRMAGQSLSVYALVGEETWVNEPDALLSALREIAHYNSSAEKDSKLSGVVVDVEPYLLEEWDAGEKSRAALMERYLACMASAYGYAAEQDLFLWACIPTFYNAACEEVLEPLIARCCDGVAVMNYNRADEYGQMAHEVGLARAYDKHIVCIYELQKPGTHGLEEMNTYANLSLSDVQSSWDRLAREFGYDKLSYAYHYYEPLCELLGK